jgi:hypothetical protein
MLNQTTSTDEDIMHTFLTPEPITIEIRNASGEIRVDLADVATTTVDVVAATSHPLGFLDDVIRAAKAQFAGDRQAYGGGRSRFDSASTGFESDTMQDDPTERVRIEHRPPSAPADIDGTAPVGVGAGTLIVDTDPARDGWKSSFTVHITAPTASGIRIQSQSADITVTGRSERLEARTASGDVRIDEVSGRSVVQTASGDVSITATAECDVRTASGDIEVQSVTSDAIVHSTSGDIRLVNPAGNINARSVSGDVTVLDATSGSAQLVTVSGDVEVGIHAGSLTAVDLSTVSGTTNTDFEVTDEAPRADPASDEGSAGPADEAILDLRVKTTSGNIRLRRSVPA